MRIAHPAVDQLQFANTALILFRCVVTGVDVFELWLRRLNLSSMMDR
jgi:hypothetical protein